MAAELQDEMAIASVSRSSVLAGCNSPCLDSSAKRESSTEQLERVIFLLSCTDGQISCCVMHMSFNRLNN